MFQNAILMQMLFMTDDILDLLMYQISTQKNSIKMKHTHSLDTDVGNFSTFNQLQWLFPTTFFVKGCSKLFSITHHVKEDFLAGK